uniref:Uncharacterized protein n=1 Tax=Clastoptera arizonana TaxID=38151 RepID=A0A1B6CHU7_9HEMI
MRQNSNSERMHLILVANTDSSDNKSQAEAINQGRENIPKKWSHKVLMGLWSYLFCIILCVVFMFMIVSFYFFILGEFFHRLESNSTLNGTQNNYTVLGSIFCKPITEENFTLLALGYVDGKRNFDENVNSVNKMYYVIDQAMSDQEACGLESALRLFPEKSIYVIEMDRIQRNTSSISIDHYALLKQKYPNLNKMKAQISTVFEGTPFEDKFQECDDLAMFAAKVLLVWQYGGTSLSTNVAFMSRQIFDKNEKMCEVDRELLFCPMQCSAYVYQLIRTILNVRKHNQKNYTDKKAFVENIVDDSVKDYCGSLKLTPIGCIGVNRVKKHSVCEDLVRGCDFLRIDEWKRKHIDWKNEVHLLCPSVVKHVFPEKVYKLNL